MTKYSHFKQILKQINSTKSEVYKAINASLLNLYWQVGAYVSKKVESEDWGKAIVKDLAKFIKQTEPEIKGFSAQNIWRMKQFYETYHNNEKLSSLARELSWTNNLLTISKTNSIEEKEFYIKLSKKENYSSRELERQIDSALYERALSSNTKLSAVLREIHPEAELNLRDKYVLDFLNLPEKHSENDLKKAILLNLKQFILEIGKDFSFIGEEYRLQVGNKDFYIDLPFYHRELQCLVAVDLKVNDFKPEYVGKMDFYLEAIDHDVKKLMKNQVLVLFYAKIMILRLWNMHLIDPYLQL